jgi:hypothetical protein
MPGDPNATLPAGIGDRVTAQQATWFIRNQPWYQHWLAQNQLAPRGDAYGDVTLTGAQQQELRDLARQHGIGISDRFEVNPNGQVAEQGGHLARNILIGAGIGALALTGFGAAGIGPLAGAFGAGSGAAAGGAAATEGGLLASTPIGAGFIGPIAGGVGADISGTAAALGAAGAAGGAAAGGAAAAPDLGGMVAGNVVNGIDTGTGAIIGGGSGGTSLATTLLGGGGGTGLVGLGTNLFGNLLSTKLQTDASTSNQASIAAAAKYAADLQDAANKRAEEYARQQAENTFQNSEVTRRANYDQWAAREGRVSSLGQALGLSARDIPSYAPGVDPRYTDYNPTTNTTTPPPTSTPTGTPSAAWDPSVFGTIVGRAPTAAEAAFYSAQASAGNDWITNVQHATPGGGNPYTPNASAAVDPQYASDPVLSALAKNYAALGHTPSGPGSGPTDIQYFAQRINQTGGLTPDNTAYWFGPNGRIAKELAGGVPPEPVANVQTPQAAAPPPGSLGSLSNLTNQFWWS